jgi:hypothetical protein
MSVYVLNEIPSSLSHCGSLYDEVETHLALNYSAFILHCVLPGSLLATSRHMQSLAASTDIAVLTLGRLKLSLEGQEAESIALPCQEQF